MKVRLVFESSGPYLSVEAESDDEDAMLATAFGGGELRAKAEYARAFGGGGYALSTDRRASVRVSLFA